MLPHKLSALLILLLFMGNAVADNATGNYNQVSFEVSASKQVENDIMLASLYAQAEGSNALTLSNKVNVSINRALKELEKYKSIHVATQNYLTTPVYSKQQVIGWRVQQSIRLRSKDMALMSKVLGELQKELKLSGISFEVSGQKREQAKNSLIKAALAAFRQRAGQIATNLQHDGYRLVSMRVSGLDAPVARYKQRNMQLMVAEAGVAPEFEAGENTLNIRISGTIELE